MADMYGKGLKGKATRLHAQHVRARGDCQNCGSTINLQCAHIISRHYIATRCDLDNAFCLCAKCHLYFGKWPVEFGLFVIENIGAVLYTDLKVRAEAGVKASDKFWQSQIDYLTAATAEPEEPDGPDLAMTPPERFTIIETGRP